MEEKLYVSKYVLGTGTINDITLDLSPYLLDKEGGSIEPKIFIESWGGEISDFDYLSSSVHYINKGKGVVLIDEKTSFYFQSGHNIHNLYIVYNEYQYGILKTDICGTCSSESYHQLSQKLAQQGDDLLNYFDKKEIEKPKKIIKKHMKNNQEGQLYNIVADILTDKIGAIIDTLNVDEKIEDGIKDILSKKVEKEMIVELVVNGNKMGVNHSQFEEILRLISIKEPLFLYGPAGSGKTSIAIKAAEALNLVHYSISVNEQTNKADFLGYFDIKSKLVKTPFRKAYEEGGVFIIDEIDAGNPNVLTVLNSALSNGEMSYPDGQIKKHDNFICICTANTNGMKGSMLYIGRNILDAATLDRFIKLEVVYCKKLEDQLFNKNTLSIRDQIRKFITDNKINNFISTRSLKQIEKLVDLGYSNKDAVKLSCGYGEDILAIIKD